MHSSMQCRDARPRRAQHSRPSVSPPANRRGRGTTNYAGPGQIRPSIRSGRSLLCSRGGKSKLSVELANLSRDSESGKAKGLL
jgi:hypothetical protein